MQFSEINFRSGKPLIICCKQIISMFRKWIVMLDMSLESKLSPAYRYKYQFALNLTVQASHPEFAEREFWVNAFRKWIVIYDTACESKLSPAVSYITIRLPELLAK